MAAEEIPYSVLPVGKYISEVAVRWCSTKQEFLEIPHDSSESACGEVFFNKVNKVASLNRDSGAGVFI